MIKQDFSLIDMVDEYDLPLKNRVDEGGYYAPQAVEGTSPTSLIPEEPLREGEQYRFHFDMSKCVGCQCCVVACNEQNNNPAGVNWRRVGEVEGGQYPGTKKYHLSMACNHCLDPACLTGCPTDAYVKLENGIVKQEVEECIGCGYCTWNCPYGVPQFNPERRIVTKCDMCHERLAMGEMPACVAACPESAIQIEKVNIQEWRANHAQADAPHVPDSGMTVSTTRIILPRDLPDNLIRANRHRLEPEKPHTSLILMTVLTQLATGGFLMLWLGDFLSSFMSFFKPLHDFTAFGAAGMLAVAAIALFVAVFHLGRPLYAYKALRMWKRSWLSREVLLFALFSSLGAVYAGLKLGVSLWQWPLSEWALFVLGAAVVFLGLAGVYASAKIYQVPARPAWNTVRTPLRFFLTGLILGPLFALAVYSAYIHQESRELIALSFKGPALGFLFFSATAGLLQLMVLLGRLFYLRPEESDELYASSFLLIHCFRAHFLARIFLLILGSFVFPFAMVYASSLGPVSKGSFVFLSLVCFLLSLAGEFLGRYLFFVTVVPKNIPGSFFTGNGRGH